MTPTVVVEITVAVVTVMMAAIVHLCDEAAISLGRLREIGLRGEWSCRYWSEEGSRRHDGRG